MSFSFHSDAADHPVFGSLSSAAFGLWALAGTWTSAHRSPGFVPDRAVDEVADDLLAVDELVNASVWTRVGSPLTTDLQLTRPSTRAVNVGAVLHAKDSDLSTLIINLIQDTKRTPSSRSDAIQFISEGFTDAVRIVQQRASDELDYSGGDAFWKRVLNSAGCACGNLKTTGLSHGCGRSARIASTPRTTSPRSTSPRLSRIPTMASGSLRISSVSSSAARSSYPISTAAGRPLRVTTTRSCSRSAR